MLLVTLDTVRADHLGTYGYFRPTSPRIDALAAESVVFERLIVPVAVTLPSHTSMLTGVYPAEHGILANHAGDRMWERARLTTLATFLGARGYRTGGFVTGAPVRAGTGIEEGFDAWTEPEGPVRRGGEATDDLLAFVKDGSEPFFAWLHLFDAHGGDPLPAYADRFRADSTLTAWLDERRVVATVPRGGTPRPVPELVDRYDAEIRYLDDQVGRVIDAGRAAGWLDRTILVIAGDHGEGLGQHGLSAHGYVWEEQLRAPLLLRAPNTAPRRVPEPVSVVDLVPTLLGLLDLPDETGFLAQSAGVDLLGPLGDRPLLSHSTAQVRRAHGGAIALTLGHWRYQREATGLERLFDLASDPHELRDLAADQPDRLGRMRALAAGEARRQADRGRAFGAGATSGMDPTQRRQLEALGYVE